MNEVNIDVERGLKCELKRTVLFSRTVFYLFELLCEESLAAKDHTWQLLDPFQISQVVAN